MSSPASWRTPCSIFWTPAGEKNGLMMRRSSVCSGGSDWLGSVGGLRALAGLWTGSLENLSGWRSMSRATVALATTQWPRSPVA